jgi:hypothetical protein
MERSALDWATDFSRMPTRTSGWLTPLDPPFAVRERHASQVGDYRMSNMFWAAFAVDWLNFFVPTESMGP